MPSFRTRPLEPMIAIADPEMLQMWASEFGVDLDDLMEAVRAVGTDPADVQEELTGIPSIRH